MKQIQFVDWPDHGVPDDPSHFLEFLFRINKLKNELDLEKPTIVHCSAGVGRTGVTISLDYALENIRNILENDPIQILIKMRQQRPCLVQDRFETWTVIKLYGHFIGIGISYLVNIKNEYFLWCHLAVSAIFTACNH